METTYRFVLVAVAALWSTGCVDAATGTAVALFPARIELLDAPGLDNRHDYEISGADWDAPHRTVGDTVFVSEARPHLDGLGRLGFIMNEPAPYTAGTPLALRITTGAALASTRDLELQWVLSASLRSTTDVDLAPVELGTFSGVATRRDGAEAAIVLELGPLPDRVDVWTLVLEWELSAEDPGYVGDLAGEGIVEIVVPTLLADPVAEAPRYKQALLWSATWGAGEWDRDDPETAHAIARRMTEGIRTLEDEGHSYGSFPRPPRAEIDDRVNVYLDFDRTACGEHRGILMALIEYHGIDASWVWYRFPDDSDDEFVTGANTHYATRVISAVGREPKVWRMTNHIVVDVAGRIYDPTYTVIKDSWQEYEDWMFERYCRQTFLGFECVPNPAGYAENDGVHPRLIRADNYK